MPRKVFVSGEILTAADVNANLMDQAVQVFDDATARDAAIPSPTEGMIAYLKDSDALVTYGTAWAPAVNTASVQDNAVTASKIGAGEITAEKLAAGLAIPAGAVESFAMNTAPTGWIKANGANVSRSTYADLFDAIGTTFGVGDGSTTFGLPDLRGEFPRGWDDGRGVDSGRSFGSAQADELKSHFHRQFNAGTDFGGGRHGLTRGGGQVFFNTDSTGGTETRPRNIALLYCIKF